MTSDAKLLIFQLNQAANETYGNDELVVLLRKAVLEITEVWARLEVQRATRGNR
jgi:hypothetical protein